MQIVEKLPKTLFDSIHKKALAKLSKCQKAAYLVGIHTARMKIMGETRKTIIPPLNVFISNVTEKGVMSDCIDYRVTYNGQTFPLAHVFGSSGHLCLGNIPVPRFVSKYDLMLPLETLFLYNDRVLSHGNPRLRITDDQHIEIAKWCRNHQIDIGPNHNYLKHDTVWRIGAELLEKYSTGKAYEYADEVFSLIFTKPTTKLNQ